MQRSCGERAIVLMRIVFAKKKIYVVSRLWVLAVSQHVLSRNGLSVLHCQAPAVVEIGRRRHDHDVQQPIQTHDGPCVLQCLELGVVEVGKHRLVVEGDHHGRSLLLIVSESGSLRHTLRLPVGARDVLHEDVQRGDARPHDTNRIES